MLDANDTGLLVVDIQGKLARIVHDSKTVLANTAKLVRGAQILGLPILWLEQNPEKLGATVEEISSLLPDHRPITKYTFDACREPAFVAAVQAAGVRTWLVCGIEAHICVYQTALHLRDLGYGVELVVDCVTSRAAANRELAVSRLAARGVGITGLEMCLYELAVDCRAACFRPILELIR